MCDPYVKITIGDTDTYSSTVWEDHQIYNAGEIYTSPKNITKDTIIKFEVFDADDKVKNFDPNNLGLDFKGTVNDLMKKSHHCGENTQINNCLDVVVLWQNERTGEHASFKQNTWGK